MNPRSLPPHNGRVAAIWQWVGALIAAALIALVTAVVVHQSALAAFDVRIGALEKTVNGLPAQVSRIDERTRAIMEMLQKRHGR